MAPEYVLRIYSDADVRLADFSDFRSLAFNRRVNEPGMLTFTLPADHLALAHLPIDKWLTNRVVQVWRRNLAIGLDWRREIITIPRKQIWRYPTGGSEQVDVICIEAHELLRRRIVAYNADIADRSRFIGQPAETIIKQIVQYNASDGATTANGRLNQPTFLPISVEGNSQAGTIMNYDCSYLNVLDCVQEVVKSSGGDFDMVAVEDDQAHWRFCYYSGQLGTDRTDDVIFSVDRGNMTNVVYTYDHLDEKTVCIAGGPGQYGLRAVSVHTGPDHTADNDPEMFLDVSSALDADTMTREAIRALYESRAKRTFKFDVRQTPSSYFGLHYFLGDLVRVVYRDVDVTQKIKGVSFDVTQNGGERIRIDTETIVE